MSDTKPTQSSHEDNMNSAIVEMRAGIQRVDAFTQMLADDRKKTEEASAKEGWMRYAALATALIALVAGYCMTQESNASGNAAHDLSEATYCQTQASDQWSFFQSKSQKQMLTELEITVRAAQPGTDPKEIEALKAKVKRYEGERDDIKKKAEALEKQRDTFRKDAEEQTALANRIGQASQAFQISLAIGGLCLLSKKKTMFALTLLGCAYAIVKMVLALHT